MNNYSKQNNPIHRDNWNLYNNGCFTDSYYDNPISLGEGIKYSRNVRVPKLKRKTAWKRFYKLFPHLKGMNVIPGSSQPCYAYGVNPSTIKLKKVKK